MIQSLSAEFLSKIHQNFKPDFFTQDADTLQVYGKDWTTVHPSCPSGIAFPRSTTEVSKFLQLCNDERIPVVPSGGRTGLAGGAVAAQNEIVLNLKRMDRMDPVDPLANTVRVQAGAITEAVHQHCRPLGLTWPVDFASKGSSQVGGNIATNAGGVKVIRYGLTRNWVLGLQVVTMDGTILELNGALEKNNTGIDLRQLFIGSEGILGVITEATLKLARIPGETEVFFFALKDTTAVLKLFQEAKKAPFHIMAFEFLSNNCMEAVTELKGIRPPFARSSDAYVLLEVEKNPILSSYSDSGSSASSQGTPPSASAIDSWLEMISQKGLIQDGTLAQSPRETQEIWSIRESITESIGARGFVHKNDIALPISKLEPFIHEMYQMFQQRYHDIEIYLFGHIGDGNLHVSTLKPESMNRDEFRDRCHQTDLELFSLVQKYSGSISAEHGIGLLKKNSLHFSRTPSEIELMKGIKKVFDPHGLLNPRKIF